MSKLAENSKVAKAAQKEAATTTVAKKSSGGWEPSAFRAADLAVLRWEGLVAEDAVRIPEEEDVPNPRPHEWVCFLSFV